MTAPRARPLRAPVRCRLMNRLPGDHGSRFASCWPGLLLAAAVGWGLVSLRSLTVGVPYLNDSSMHEQMVRFATAQLRAGHLPLTSWFPFLGEGSPQFLHYQSLPAMITGAAGLLIGPDAAFRWSLYLLLALWPVSIYLAARLFGAGRPAAAVSAAMSPFLASVPGVGYEQHAYVWTGYGVWTQLWAAWTLPLAWGLSWRAIRDGRGYLGAVVLTMVTIALHFETGYLALSVLLIWPLVAGRPLRLRLRRAAIVLGGSLLASAWVVVPLLSQRSWAATNEIVRGTSLENGYGIRHVLIWLFSGQLLDDGRLPVVTVLAALGLAAAWLSWPENTDGRALLIALAVCLLLSFGRDTFGSLVDVIPGSADLFFRRFMMGVQLAALLLAGRGAASLARWLGARLDEWPAARRVRERHGLIAAAALAAVVAVLAPAWLQLGSDDRHLSRAIAAQRRADGAAGRQLNRLTAVIRRRGGGRTYAGMPTNWGASFVVGQVPVFKYLESRDVDEVGYTLRTASLMTDPEYYFDDQDPSDYRLFGVRYLILPAGRRPAVRATRVTSAGRFVLWSTGDGEIQAGRIAGTAASDRSDLGQRSIALMRSGLAARGDYLAVRYGAGGAPTPLPADGVADTAGAAGAAGAQAPAGAVRAEHPELASGRATATLQMRRPGVAVLSASYDPGWRATVNGRPAAVRMVAPALVSVRVPAGTDRVTFRFRGYGGYPELLALCLLTLAVLAGAPRCARRASTASG